MYLSDLIRVSLVMSTVGVVGCGSRSSDAELARARAEAAEAKAELERTRAGQKGQPEANGHSPGSGRPAPLTAAEQELRDLGVAWAKSQNYPTAGLTDDQLIAFGRHAKQQSKPPTNSPVPSLGDSTADDEVAGQKIIGTWSFQNREYVFGRDGKFQFYTTGELQSKSGTWKIRKGKLILTYVAFLNASNVECEFSADQNRLTFKKDPLYYHTGKYAVLNDVVYNRK